MIAEIGEFEIYFNNKAYQFKPTLERMLSIGNGSELIELFSILHGKNEQEAIDDLLKYNDDLSIKRLENSRDEVLKIALITLNSCTDDDIDELVGYYNDELKYIDGEMSKSDIVLIAQSLLQHGVIGKHKMKNVSQNGGYTKDIDLMQYITTARVHLGFSDAEARNLSMTELLKLIDEKCAQNKENKKGYTAEEYEEIKRDYLESKTRMLERIKANPELDKPVPRGINR